MVSKTLSINPGSEYDYGLECIVLGSTLVHTYLFNQIYEMVQQDYDFFYDWRNREVYKAMVYLFEKDTTIGIDSINAHAIKNYLQMRPPVVNNTTSLYHSLGIIEQQSCSMDYLNFLISNAQKKESQLEELLVLKNKYIFRCMISSVDLIKTSTLTNAHDMNMVVEDAEKVLYDISRRMVTIQEQSFRDSVMKSVLEKENIKNKIVSPNAILSGYSGFDKITGGVRSGELNILAARASMGKTAFALNLAKKYAELGHPVFMFGFEMTKEEYIDRLLFIGSQVRGSEILRGNITDDDLSRLLTCAKPLAYMPIYIDDTPSMSPMQLRARLRRMLNKYRYYASSDSRCPVVIVDYLQIMDLSIIKASTNEKISYATRTLKTLARELDVPLWVLSQLSREVEKRIDKRPMLSDLRDSGSIEQDADKVVFIFREWYYDHTKNRENADIIIAKNRNGPLGKILYNFDDSCGLFEENDTAW